MRIASMQYQATMLRSLNLNQGVLTDLTSKMANGTRLLVPSDDPIANVRLSRLNREQAIVNQYVDNIDALKIRLAKNESYLDGMVNDMNAGRDLLVWALDGGNTPDDLKSMVNSLTALRDSVFYNANTRDQEGKYIFSGTETNTPAMTYDPAAPLSLQYAYAGNTQQQQVVVGNGVTQVANVDVSGLQDWLNQINGAIEALKAPGADPNDATTRAALQAALSGTDTGLDAVSQKIATFGGVQNVMATLSANHTNVALSNNIALHDIGDLDYADAGTQLTGYKLALEATYQAYGQISKLSLFDAL